MPEQSKLLLDFIVNRINTKIGDIRDAGSQEEIEIYCNDLDSYLDGLKIILALEKSA